MPDTPVFLPGTPRPYPDEMLYSIIARTGKYLAIAPGKPLASIVLGDSLGLAVPDLPTRLRAVAGWLHRSIGLSLDEIALEHTATAYHTHLLGQSAYRSMVRSLLGVRAHAHARLGISASSVRGTARFRMCRHCVSDDLSTFGETYWRRSHQLPGVLVCPTHGLPLHETNVRFRSPGRHEHIAASPRMLESGNGAPSLSTFELAKAATLAQDSAELARAMPPSRGAPIDYRQRLQSLGYLGGNAWVRRIQAEFEGFYGRRLLGLLFKANVSGSYTNWLYELARRPRRAPHPVKHLLLEQFLAGKSPGAADGETSISTPPTKSWGVYRSAELRAEAARLAATGLTTSALARHFGIDWKTAARLCAPLPEVDRTDAISRLMLRRSQWERLEASNPGASKTALRREAPALYSALYRADRSWLVDRPHRPVRRPQSSRRVNWPARDERLASEVRNIASQLREALPPIRITRSRILGILEARARVNCYGHHLPKTRGALSAVSESVESFQVRRLATVMKAELGRGPLPPAWRLLRSAGINQMRLVDSGQALIAAATERVGESL